MPNPNFEELAHTFAELSVGRTVSPESQQAAYKQAAQIFSKMAQNTWVAPTGNVSRATFDPATATLVQVGERLSALIRDLMT